MRKAFIFTAISVTLLASCQGSKTGEKSSSSSSSSRSSSIGIQTYQNNTYGFSFAYPQTDGREPSPYPSHWCVGDAFSPYRSGTNYEEIDVCPGRGKDLPAFLHNLDSATVTKQNLQIGNEPAVQVILTGSGGSRIFFAHEGCLYQLFTDGWMQEHGVLASWRFIEVPHSACSTAPVLHNFGPLSFTTENMDVSVSSHPASFPPEWIAYLRKDATQCGGTKTQEYYDHVADLFSSTRGTEYVITDRKYSKVAMHISLLPNKMHYLDFSAFRNDFFGCGAGGSFPITSSNDWLVFSDAGDCGELSGNDVSIINARCSLLQNKLEPSIQVK